MMNELVLEDRGLTTADDESKLKVARLAVATCFFLNGLLIASWTSRIPAVQAQLGLSHGALGMALFGIALGALVAMPIAGWLVARIGSHRVTQFSAIGFCAGLPLLAIAPNAWTLAVVLFAIGTVHGSFDVSMNAQAVAVEDRVGRPIMSSFHALWSLGGLAGAALGALIAAGGVSPLIHFATAAWVVGAGILAVVLPRLLDARETEGAGAVVRGNSEGNVPQASSSRLLMALGFVAFCIMMGEGAMADWGAIYLRDFTAAKEGVAAAGYAAFSVAMAAVRLMGDSLAVRLGPPALVRIGAVVAALGLAVSLSVGNSLVAILGFAAVGAGFATIVPQIFSVAGKLPGVSAGSALATVSTVGYTGFLVGPPLIGFIAEGIGLRGALSVVVVMSAIACAFAGVLRTSENRERRVA